MRGRGVFKVVQMGEYIACEWAMTVNHTVMIIHRSRSTNVQCIMCRLAVRSDVDRFVRYAPLLLMPKAYHQFLYLR